MYNSLNQNKSTLFYLLSALLLITLATQIGSRTGIQPLVMLGVISPLLLAMAYSYWEQGKEGIKSLFGKPTGFTWSWKVTLFAILFPIVLPMVAVAISNGHLAFPDPMRMLKALPFLLILMTGEEFGWRRFAFARLMKSYSFITSATVVAIVWALWHFPGYLVGMGVPLETPFWLFFLMVIPMSFLITYVYHISQNVWLAIAAHVSSNLAFTSLPFLPEVMGETDTFTVYVIILWLVSLPIWLNKSLWKHNEGSNAQI